MKTMILGLFLCFQAQAGTPVYNSLYMALGAGVPSYFSHLAKIRSAVEASGFSGDVGNKMQTFVFNSADVVGTDVTYFFASTDVDGEWTCTTDLTFKVSTKSKMVVLNNVTADHFCHKYHD
jgi:hypothetical protein